MLDAPPRFRVVVQYPADEYDAAIDERIETCVDRDSDFTGCGLVDGATRDIGWDCKTAEEAEEIADAVRDGYEGWPQVEVEVRS